ncbi:MAG: oxidoreductase [Gammaproteobacteria bacterium]
MKKITVGLIGFGFAAEVFHIPLIQAVEGLQLTAIATSRPEQVKAKFSQVQTFPTAAELIAQSDIDLVIITAPNLQHFPLAQLALQHGKHIVVEKPFVIESAQGQVLIDLAQEQHCLLSVYQNRRWDNDFLALQNCIAQQQLGDIYYYECRFERYRPVTSGKWREQDLPGSGKLYDLGSHLIDQALCLFGWPLSIYAEIASLRPNAKTDDYFHILLDYPQLKVVLHSSQLVKEPGPRFTVHGSKGSFLKYGFDPQEKFLSLNHKLVPEILQPALDNTLIITGETSQTSHLAGGRYQSYYEEIYQALITPGKAPPVTATQALQTIQLIELAIQSDQRREKIYL